MNRPKIVSQDEWLKARKALLEREKAFSRERDALSAARRDLPMVKVDKPYSFDGEGGSKTLADLFGDHRQLIVYHFMFDPAWTEGCRACSLIADHVEGMLPHLGARSTAFAAISRAPLPKLLAFKQRMGWRFPWLSSAGNDFNYDYGVSFRGGDKEAGKLAYNFGTGSFPTSEAPGLSTFLRDGDSVLHAYSTYARGLDTIIGAYEYLDLTPLGRQEQGLPSGMAWVKHHDKYAAG